MNGIISAKDYNVLSFKHVCCTEYRIIVMNIETHYNYYSFKCYFDYLDKMLTKITRIVVIDNNTEKYYVQILYDDEIVIQSKFSFNLNKN